MDRKAALVVLAALLSGCVASPSDLQPTDAPAPPVPSWPVVALIDTGINPWHEAFLSTTPDAAPPFYDVAVPATFRDRLEREGHAAWDELEMNTVYWFEGTKVLAISKNAELEGDERIFEAVFPRDPHPIYDDVNHGTAVASVLSQSAPHAWILMVETTALSLPGFEWAADQPWIDVLSTSRSRLGHVPDNVSEEKNRWAVALHRASDLGKIVLAAGGNTPDPNLLSFSGAPWVISVGGAAGDRQGVSPWTSQPVDVVADLSWPAVARNSTNNGTFHAAGTSFGAPWVAGVVAEALHQVRTHFGHAGGMSDGALVRTPAATLTQADFRKALNLSATYWAPADYRLSIGPAPPFFLPFEVTTPAVPAVAGTPVGPWVQMGWGHVDAATADTMAAILTGSAPAPEKPDAEAYMNRLFEARMELWRIYGRG